MSHAIGLALADMGGGSIGQFSPISLAPSLWLDGGSLSAGPVASWPDISGNSRSYAQGTGANQPGFSSDAGPNGLPCVTFSGTQWLVFTGAYASRRNWTVFVVLKLANTSTIMRTAVWGASHGVQGTNLNKRELVLPGVADLTDSTSNSTTNWELWVVQDNGTIQSMRVNGTAHTLSGSGTPAIPTTDNGVGATGTAGANPFTGSIQSIIRYESTLALSDIQKVETYIRNKTLIW